MSSGALYAALAVGGLMLVERRGAGTGIAQQPSVGSNAFAEALRAQGAIAGAAFEVAPNPNHSFLAFRRELVANRGDLDDGNAGTRYPRNMTIGELVEVVDAWLAAFRIARDTDESTAIDLKLSACPDTVGALVSKRIYERAAAGKPLASNPFELPEAFSCPAAAKGAASTNYRTWHLSPLGLAVCSLLTWRRDVQTGAKLSDVVEPLIIETFDRLSLFAVEVEAVTFAWPGMRPSQDPLGEVWDADEVLGGVVHAAKESGAFVVDVAGDVASAAAGALVKMPWLWAAGFGLLAWRVLR